MFPSLSPSMSLSLSVSVSLSLPLSLKAMKKCPWVRGVGSEGSAGAVFEVEKIANAKTLRQKCA